MNGVVVEAEGLSKIFPGGTAALADVCLSIQEGSLVCLLGANGSGKTTLLKILAGIIPPDGGRAAIAGADLGRHPEEARLRAGFSPGEDRSFYGRLSCLENLRFFARLRGMSEARFQGRLDELEGVLALRESLPSDYQRAPAGVRQRLSLARALLHDPPLLLLDEPTRSLDPEASERLRAFVAAQVRGSGRTALWSTHNVEEAWALGGEILILSRGRIAARGTPEALLKRGSASKPAEAYRALAS